MNELPCLRRTLLTAGRVGALMAMAAIAGCSSCPPFRAGWYLDDPGPQAADPSAAPIVYLALLHEGRKAVALTQVIVNPTGSDRGRVVLQGTVNDKEWQPGELRVFRVEDKELGACSLPVAVQIQCGAHCSSAAQAVSGALPSFLHDAWLDRCQPLKDKTP